MQSNITSENNTHEIGIEFPEPETPNKKRKNEGYKLDERLHEQFSWNDEDAFPIANKRIKLNNLFNRRETLNSCASFTNLVSSASLILPPEIDTVVITKDKFVVEWNQDSESIDIPPTQVKQVLYKGGRSEIGDEIHQNSFKIPVYYCNSSTPQNIAKKICEEKRMLVQSQITDTETSLSPVQVGRYTEMTKLTLKKAANKKREKFANDKLSRSIQAINESLEYFIYIPSKYVLVRDKKKVNILIPYYYFVISRSE
jgi:hypothetical protein